MTKDFTPNTEYVELLLKNSDFHKKVREKKASYDSAEYFQLRKSLLKIEKVISAQEIIDHAEHTFPAVGGA